MKESFDFLGWMYIQYFSINKLVEYYNDEEVSQEAIRAITPSLTNENSKLSDAATFELSVLKKEFNEGLWQQRNYYTMWQRYDYENYSGAINQKKYKL